MNTGHRGQDNWNTPLSENNLLTFLSRPLLSHPILEELLRSNPVRSPDPEGRPMTSTTRRPRAIIEESSPESEETLSAFNFMRPNELNIIPVQGLNSYGVLGSAFFSLMEQLQSFEEESKQGLPKEMIDKVKRMKMGKSGQECSVCSEGFKKGEKIRKLPCKHIFHEKCILPWLEMNSSCPNCRFNLMEFFTENPDGEY